jgi:predicted tellurium resistance membrane protein TerC
MVEPLIEREYIYLYAQILALVGVLLLMLMVRKLISRNRGWLSIEIGLLFFVGWIVNDLVYRFSYHFGVDGEVLEGLVIVETILVVLLSIFLLMGVIELKRIADRSPWALLQGGK